MLFEVALSSLDAKGIRRDRLGVTAAAAGPRRGRCTSSPMAQLCPPPPTRSASSSAEHDPVNAPRHYRSHPSGIECIEVTRRLSFDVGNAVKYVWRRADKGTAVQDVEKALFYLRDARTNGPTVALRPHPGPPTSWTPSPNSIRIRTQLPSSSASPTWTGKKPNSQRSGF